MKSNNKIATRTAKLRYTLYRFSSMSWELQILVQATTLFTKPSQLTQCHDKNAQFRIKKSIVPLFYNE